VPFLWAAGYFDDGVSRYRLASHILLKGVDSMIRISKLGLCAVIVGALAFGASVAQAQGDAKKGKSVYSSKGCGACHAIGKPGTKMAGPDLAGVTQRRSSDWLKRWLKDPTAMFGSDSTADAILAEAKNVKMPNMKLGDADIAALIAYLAEHPAP